VELRRDNPMPSYGEELERSQRGAVRAACLLAAGILVAFSALDRALVPQAFLPLLGIRAFAALLLLACARWGRTGAPVRVLIAAVALTAGTIESALLLTGSAGSPYLFSMMLVQAGVSILVPLQLAEAALLNVEVLAIAFLPLSLRAAPLHPLTAVAASYLACMAVVSVGGAFVQDRLRRREHQARAEFARHFGLLNLGTLAGGLAHELANPLNALGLQVEMLAKDPASAAKRVPRLLSAVGRMRDILEAMRNGARVSSVERRSVDLAHEMDLAFTLMEGRLRNRISMVRAYAQLPSVFCQPTLLGQVLVNLLSNAADAVAGRPHPRIALRLRREDGFAVVEVEDNGPGVPEELHEQIFLPFFSTKGDAGNGLGLWISSEIARIHGGSLSVQRGSSGGALFRLTLPIDARDAPREEGPQAAAHA
jgi:signal transduction histidine kinase